MQAFFRDVRQAWHASIPRPDDLVASVPTWISWNLYCQALGWQLAQTFGREQKIFRIEGKDDGFDRLLGGDWRSPVEDDRGR